jgi:uncharacterized YigZ family protein
MAFTLSAPVHSELIIKKSRFIGCVQSVADRTAAHAVVAALRATHPGAAHVCWALMAGGQSAANDDGEPGGTAGRPMLEVLRHQQLEGVLATVVRYFGGVKLGAGGLVRAYTDAVAQALINAPLVPRIARSTLSCEVPYPLEGAVRRELAACDGALESVSHSDLVLFCFNVARSQLADVRQRIQNATQGRVSWKEFPTDGSADGLNVST